ncbi:transposable element Tcb2 transposase [Trichonephila clavipes]|uniref:Transposable element Tcb2 transposase n=1 Tax=Trichonephila clavipes TaxID=2585209 RepID=A0A8X6SNZ3_TRICX|nr:transposable element Tcb2 transposase [Trichonephila clavipes]
MEPIRVRHWVDKAYTRQRVSGTVVRMVTTATNAGYQDLREFERGVIVSAREMGHSISEEAMKFWFSCTTMNIGNPTVDDRKHIAWSDESRFQLNRADGSVWVWRQFHKSRDPTCQQGTVQAGGGSVMVWSVCGWHDMRPLIRLDTTLIDDKYVSILFDYLHPFISIVHSNGFGEFQQDNATPYTSRIATE